MYCCAWLFQSDVIKVCVTGAAGQIAYSLLYSVAKGDVFGADQVSVFTHQNCKKDFGIESTSI